MINRGNLEAAIADVGLAEHSGPLLALARESAIIELTKASTVGTGASRFGGLPDLPRSADWPDNLGTPLTFLAQLRIADLPSSLDGLGILPDRGTLAFFYDVGEQPWGFEDDRFGSALLWVDDAEPLAARAAPTGTGVLPSFAASFRPVLSMPGWETIEIEEVMGGPPSDVLVGTVDQQSFVDRYLALHRRLAAEAPAERGTRWGSIHRVMGWPDEIQGDLHRANDHWAGRPHEATSSCPHDWRLVLQIDTDDRLGVMWGDVGRIYWSIDAAADPAERLDHPPVILQCT